MRGIRHKRNQYRYNSSPAVALTSPTAQRPHDGRRDPKLTRTNRNVTDPIGSSPNLRDRPGIASIVITGEGTAATG